MNNTHNPNPNKRTPEADLGSRAHAGLPESRRTAVRGEDGRWYAGDSRGWLMRSFVSYEEAIAATMDAPGPLLEFTVPCPMIRKRSKATGQMSEVPGWYNANHRLVPIVESKRRELWRNAGMDAAVAAGLPKGLEQRLFIEAWFHMTREQSYDAMNLYPSAKGIVDGLIGSKTFPGYGLAVGDDNEWLVGPVCLPGAKDRDDPRVVVRVFALSKGELYPSSYTPYDGRHKVTR